MVKLSIHDEGGWSHTSDGHGRSRKDCPPRLIVEGLASPSALSLGWEGGRWLTAPLLQG